MPKSWNDEERALDAALANPDPILAASLQADEQRRQRRATWRWAILGCLLVLIVAGAILPFMAGSTSAADGSQLAAEGWQLWQSRRLVEAEQKFMEATKLDPNSMSGWNGLGWARLNQGKFMESQAAFQKCLELAPDHGAALNGMGQSSLGLHDYASAETWLLKAAPTANAAWFGLARLYLVTEKYDQAIPWINKIMALEPQNDLHKQMLDAAQKKSIPDELRMIIEPPSPLQREIMDAWTLHNMGMFKEGKEKFLQLKSKNPDNAAILNGLGFCLLNMGDFKAAKPEFERCLELDPNAAGAMNGLARCLKSEGNVDQAIEWWKKLDALTPEANAGTIGLATTYMEQGQHANAIPYFEKAVRDIPGNPYFQQQLQACRNAVENSPQQEK